MFENTNASASCLSDSSKELDLITSKYVNDHKSDNIRFPSKVSFPDYDLFEKTLSCASMIRDFGDAKYWSHSWERDPKASDGLIENIISAYWRHFLLWTNGILTDESGHHHLTHMACRVLMMVTRLRRILTPSEHVPFIEDVSVIYTKKYKVNLSQITTELFTSMVLYNTDPCVNDNKSFLVTSIKKELITLVGVLSKLDNEDLCTVFDPYEVNPADKIFYYTNNLINICTDELLKKDLEDYKYEDGTSVMPETKDDATIVVNDEKRKSIFVRTEETDTILPDNCYKVYEYGTKEDFMKD